MMPSKESFHVSGREISRRMQAGEPIFAMDSAEVDQYLQLAAVGLGLDAKFVKQAAAWAMDDAQGGVFTASIGTPVQFLQAWLPGFVRAVFAVRKIDELIGITTVGNWHDEEVVQGMLENMGDAVPYGDYSNVPLSSWNVNFERRTIVRFEKGMKVGKLEEARASAMRISTSAEKRTSCSLALDIQRNNVGFSGYNSGADRTYGFLNDPSLPAYVNVATGAASDTKWSTKTLLEIITDLLEAFTALNTQTQGVVDPIVTETTLALPTGIGQYLGTPSSYGYSVMEWLKNTYPKCRPVMAPQLNAANGSANVFYLFADKVDDSASDDSRTWVQAVPAKFQTLGVQNEAKGYIEDYTNATAGAMCKRPYAVVRRSGI